MGTEYCNQQLDQLRDNAKAHKKQIDKLTARLGQVTQQRDDAAAQLMVKEQEAAFFRAEFERLRDVMPDKVERITSQRWFRLSVRLPTNTWFLQRCGLG